MQQAKTATVFIQSAFAVLEEDTVLNIRFAIVHMPWKQVCVEFPPFLFCRVIAQNNSLDFEVEIQYPDDFALDCHLMK